MQMGFAFIGAPSVPQMVKLAQLAEALGYESVWVAETRLTRDSIIPAGAIAQATRRVQIGSACVNVYTRGAILVGVTFASLDELSGGRAILGIATGSPLVLQAQGYAFDRPLTRLREYVKVINDFLGQGRVSFEGQTLRVPGATLDFDPVRRHIPIYLGATGPKALELAGEIADGVFLNGFLPVAYAVRARERIAAGAKRAGRSPTDIRVAQGLVASMDRDGGAARDRIRGLVAIYLTHFPNIARETGLSPEYLSRLNDAMASGGSPGAAALVGDEVLNLLVIAGTPEECRARVREYNAAGVEVPVIAAIGEDLRLAVEEFAPHKF